MPFYMYRCRNCNHEFETRQRMVEDPLVTCPNCDQDKLRRVIDQVQVVFKGSGFYVTDNKGNNPAGVTKASEDSGNASSDTKSENKSESKSETKSESKSETKSESKSKSETKPKNKSGKSDS